MTHSFHVPKQYAERCIDLEVGTLEFENLVQVLFQFLGVDGGLCELDIVVFYGLAHMVYCAQCAPKEKRHSFW